jgi:hypothetical protein
MREDVTDQYLSYKLIESNQDWKSKWFYICNHHPELLKPSGKQPKHRVWWNIEPTMQDGIQLPELMNKIKALREAGLRAEHVAFSFIKKRVQPLMARDTLEYQYTGNEDTSRMPSEEVDDKDIIERLAKYSRICRLTLLAQSPSSPRLVRRTRYLIKTSALEYLLIWSSRAHPSFVLQDDIAKYVPDPIPPPRLEDIPEESKGKVKERREVGEGDDTVTIEDTSN